MLTAAALVARLYCPAALMTCDMPCMAAPCGGLPAAAVAVTPAAVNRGGRRRHGRLIGRSTPRLTALPCPSVMTGQATKIMKIQIRFMKIPPKEDRTLIQSNILPPGRASGNQDSRRTVFFWQACDKSANLEGDGD